MTDPETAEQGPGVSTQALTAARKKLEKLREHLNSVLFDYGVAQLKYEESYDKKDAKTHDFYLEFIKQMLLLDAAQSAYNHYAKTVEEARSTYIANRAKMDIDEATDKFKIDAELN